MLLPGTGEWELICPEAGEVASCDDFGLVRAAMAGCLALIIGDMLLLLWGIGGDVVSVGFNAG